MVIEKTELSIYDVQEIHTQLLDEFNNESVVIDLDSVHKIDMSIIQLLVSAQKSAKKSSKTFKLQNINSEVKDILKKTACEFLIGDGDE